VLVFRAPALLTADEWLEYETALDSFVETLARQRGERNLIADPVNEGGQVVGGVGWIKLKRPATG
jgi:hypothetical protein